MNGWPIKSFCQKHNWGSYAENEPCPFCAGEKVPAIVRDFDEQVVPDLKNVFSLAKDLFTGDLLERHGFVDPKVQPPQPPVLPSYQPTFQVPAPMYTPQAPTPPTVESERIIDVPVDSACATCGGSRKVGMPGYQVTCPLCGTCKTCDGRGMVGMKGHEVACPMCSAKPR